DLMIAEENHLLKIRKKEYYDNSTLTPLMSLSITFIALVILIISFYKINRDRRKMSNTESFLKNILKSTDNIISHFVPVRNKNEEIIDFKIAYTNEEIINLTGDTPEKIEGKLIS